MSRVLPVLALLLGLATACGGSSGGGALPGPGGGSTNIMAGFVADRATPAAETVSLAQGTASADLVTVRVDITDIAGVYGASFDLSYDPTMATFLRWTAGSVLEQGGHTPEYTINAARPGLLIVGATRKGNVTGVDVNGTRALVLLTFRVLRTGDSAVAFQAQALFDDQIQPQPIPGLSWFGGTLVGN